MLQFSVSTIKRRSTITFIAVVFTLAVYMEKTEAVAEWDTGFTTDDLEAKFKAKCIEFGKLPRTPMIYDENKFNDKGCGNIWTKFIGVIDEKKKETVPGGYRDFFKYIEDNFYKSGFNEDEFFKDKVTFWSGPLPQKFLNFFSATGNTYLTLASLVQGFVVDIDGAAWCGDPEKGVIYESDNNLPGPHCPYSPVQLYWEEASKDLAKKAKGETFLFLPAVTTDTHKAYRKGSFFADIELPQLDKSKNIKSLNVILLPNFADKESTATALCWDNPKIKTAKDKSMLVMLKQIEEETNHIKTKKYACTDADEGGLMRTIENSKNKIKPIKAKFHHEFHHHQQYDE